MNTAGFWQHESQHRGSDWNGLMRLRASLAPLTCDICGAAPCLNPGFCRLCRQGDAKAARSRPDSKTEWLRGLLDKHQRATRRKYKGACRQ